MSSTASPPTSSDSPLGRKVLKGTAEYLQRKGRLKQWMGVLAGQSLEDHADRQAQNLEAEERAVRRAAWGEQPGEATEGEDMRETVLGDKTITQHVYPQAVKHGMGTAAKLAGIAMLALGVPAGIAVLKAPEIIKALKPNQPPVATPVDHVPILLPGKP